MAATAAVMNSTVVAGSQGFLPRSGAFAVTTQLSLGAQLRCELFDSQGLGSLSVGRKATGFCGGDLDLGVGSDTTCPARIVMAVPKKRMSRTKTKIRRAIWKAQSKDAALKAFSLGSSVLTGRSKSFLYETSEKKGDAAEETKEVEGEEDAPSS